jgi:hypothetical protein
MTEIRFTHLVNKHFGFLVRQYGYKIKFIDQSDDPDPSIEDGESEIRSSKSLIYIMKSRFDYALTIRPVGEPQFTEMSPVWILKALAIPIQNPPRDVRLGSFEWFLVLNAHLLNNYCNAFITGDFSEWLNVLEYFNKSTKDDYFVKTGKELPQYIYRELEEYIKDKKLDGHYP